jgi:hypothetical protein
MCRMDLLLRVAEEDRSHSRHICHSTVVGRDRFGFPLNFDRDGGGEVYSSL